tara:strand:- start:2826 stop:4733 length:1908 start_codon:yes stop_codon:yes gene_type:complete
MAIDYSSLNGVFSSGSTVDPIAEYKKRIEGFKTRSLDQQTLAKRLLQEQQRQQKQATIDIHGEQLGQVYDAHRDAINMYRDFIESTFDSGAYDRDPGRYENDVANLSNMIKSAKQHYQDTYGNASAKGQGNTYMDIMIRDAEGGAEDFYLDQDLELQNDEYLGAQQTLSYLNTGGYDPKTIRIDTDGNVVAKPIDMANGARSEQEIPIFDMPHINLGSNILMANVKPAQSIPLEDFARTDDVYNWIKTRTGKWNEEDAGAYWDTHIDRTGKDGVDFRRMIFDTLAKDIGTSSEVKNSYIQTGLAPEGYESDVARLNEEGRKVFILNSERYEQAQTTRTTDTRTADQKNRADRQARAVADLSPTRLSDAINIGSNNYEQLINNNAQNDDGVVTPSEFLKKQNESTAEQTVNDILFALKNAALDADDEALANIFEKVEVEQVFTPNPFKNVIKITSKNTSQSTGNVDLSVESNRVAAYNFLMGLIPTTTAVELPDDPTRFEYTLSEFKSQGKTIRIDDPENPGTKIDVNPVDFAFWPDGTIALKNVIRPLKEGKTGSTVGGQTIPLVVLNPATSNGSSAIKQINAALRDLYGKIELANGESVFLDVDILAAAAMSRADDATGGASTPNDQTPDTSGY